MTSTFYTIFTAMSIKELSFLKKYLKYFIKLSIISKISVDKSIN